jgi:Ni/Fe-hydrogenase 1 B-type cytochrome subunit
MATSTFKRAYIWQLPVRMYHWTNALAIVVLAITGLIIANPPGIVSTNAPSEQFWFGYVRKIHFMSAYIMIAVWIVRFYWALVGNKYAQWRVFFPYTKEGFKKMWHVIKYDIFLQNEKEYNFKNISIGHNPIAAVSYFILFLMSFIMILTGFAMYSPTATWFFPRMFGWVISFLGNEVNVRLVHHITMWGIILFTVIHVYLVWFHDWLEGRGEGSAMISGHKFVRAERLSDERFES